jgi:hypothetical protein
MAPVLACQGCTCRCAHVRDSMLRDPLLATIPLATERGRVGIMGGDWVICDAQCFRHRRAQLRGVHRFLQSRTLRRVCR